MKMTKQSRDAMVLGVALLVLVIVAVQMYRGQQTASKPPAKPRVTERVTAARSTKKAAPRAAMVTWVDADRLARLVAEAESGRNPFKDIISPAVAAPAEHKPAPPPPGGGRSPIPSHLETMGTLPGTGTITVEHRLTWLSLTEVRALVQAMQLAVEVKQKSTKVVILTGDSDEVDAAQEKIEERDTPPRFVLIGVIISPMRNQATIMADGALHTLFVGDATPSGWVLARVTSTGVTMTKQGCPEVPVRLAGGNAP